MKNQKTFLILFIVFCFSSLQAQVTQEWAARYNGSVNGIDGASSLVVDDSGNVYVTGYSSNGTNMDYATIKYNSSGAQKWIQRYNGPGNGNDKAYSIALDGSGNVCVIGRSDSDFTTIVYNSSGVIKWIQRHQGTGGLPVDFVVPSVAADDSGNVYAAGYSREGGSSTDYVTIKYNSSGVQQWIQTYYGGLMEKDIWLYVLSLAIDHSGNVYVTGAAGTDISTISDFATIKYNSSGVQQWVQRYNGLSNNFDGAYSIAVDSSGNVYVTGYSRNGPYYDYLTIKYNSSGDSLWVQRYNGTIFVDDIARSVALDRSGNVYVTGTSINNNGTDGDYVTIKYSSSGVQQWVKNYNGPGNSYDGARSLAVDSLGNVYVTGGSYRSGNNYDYATIKYNTTGVQQWVQIYDNGYANSLVVDNSGNVYVTGRSNDDYATIKYSQSTGITQTSNSIPEKHSLSQNYPNPFNPNTVISYQLSVSSITSLKIYDVLGNNVSTLVNEKQNVGTYEVEFDGNNYSSGVYFYTLQTDNFFETKKMTLIK